MRGNMAANRPEPPPKAPRKYNRPAPNERRTETKRRALRQALNTAQLTPTEAARAAGMPNANALFNFLNGRTQSLSQETYEKLAQVIPGATIASLAGLEPAEPLGVPVRPIQVRAMAAAGLMQASFDMPLSHQGQIVVPVDPELHAAGVFGAEVREPGAEKIFTPGTILICQPMSTWDGELRNGKRLILQRIRGPKVEVTVRELELQANEAWLWLRSTHPEHQVPIRMPYTPGKPLQPWRDGEDRYSVAAVVIAAYMPQP